MYLTLPSNSSAKQFPKNTLTQFSTRLPRNVQLQGEWEVALSEIVYPHNWHNIEAEHCYITLRSKTVRNYAVKINLVSGWYGARELAQHITNHVEDNGLVIKGRVNAENLRRKSQTGLADGDRLTSFGGGTYARNDDPDKLILDINHRAFDDKYTLAISDPYQVQFSPQLARCLGLQQDHTVVYIHTDQNHPYISRVPADLSPNRDIMYVNCSLIRPQIVGDQFTQLLRTVTIKGKHGAVNSHIFTTRQYVDVMVEEFNEVHIELTDKIGSLIPFITGHVVVVLHLQPKPLI